MTVPSRALSRALYQPSCRAGNSMPPDCLVQCRFAAVPAGSLSSRWYSGASAWHASGILALFGQPGLEPVAREVEDAMIRIIDASCE